MSQSPLRCSPRRRSRVSPRLGSFRRSAPRARPCCRHDSSSTRWQPHALLASAPYESHPVFRAIAARLGIALARQGGGDLGARMLAAIAAAATSTLVIGTDCPALTSGHLRAAADILRRGTDAAIIPAEDGGYALIGLRSPVQALFSDMHWSAPTVMDETRRRLKRLGLTWREPVTLWDLDVPEDLERLRKNGLHHLIPPPNA